MFVTSRSSGGNDVILAIHPNTNADFLVEIEESEASKFGEVTVQLREGCSYHYDITKGFQLDPVLGVVEPFSEENSNLGLLTTGIYTGTLRIAYHEILKTDNVGCFDLEIRSKKTEYRSDYRFMLEEIAEKCTELILEHSSPVLQKIEPNFELDQKSLYQKFAFLNSFIGSDDFFESITRITTSPVTKWTSKEISGDIRNIGRISNNIVRQVASSPHRFSTSGRVKDNIKLETLPNRIVTSKKDDSIDTPENQFIKYILTEYFLVCSEISLNLSKGSRERKEAEKLTSDLRNILDRPKFREITNPHVLQFNSPVLQRKEGYREIYRSWLMFNIASKLVWTGGEDVYEAGKKDVARLYEYWVFFKLLELVNSVFIFPPRALEELIVSSDDNLNLNLRLGKTTTIIGYHDSSSRKLKVEFSYNKTFSGSDYENYPQGGSWTKTMRPDYTLSIWPFEFTSAEAEAQELIVHIHFDAKYRIENIKESFGPSSTPDGSELGDIEPKEEMGIYKRGDLLKMHAYKDAIRRTAGAYVLYPGDENMKWKGFHEIIPGLGAFTIRPNKSDEGTAELRKFLNEVVDQFINRASQHENSTYYVYETYSKPPVSIREKLPEKIDGKRTRPPLEVFVLVGYCKSKEHKSWIEKNHLYNIRLDALSTDEQWWLTQHGSSSVYLLLHHKNELVTSDIWRISNFGPKVLSRTDLLDLGYPEPSGDHYLVYEVKPETDEAFSTSTWDVRELPGYQGGIRSSRPFTVSINDLIKAKIKNIDQ